MATKLVALREALPASVDVSSLVSKRPELILDGSGGDIAAKVAQLRQVGTRDHWCRLAMIAFCVLSFSLKEPPVLRTSAWSPVPSTLDRERLGNGSSWHADLGKILNEEPMLLTVDVNKVLERLQRLMPNVDPIEFLVANPRVGIADAARH